MMDIKAFAATFIILSLILFMGADVGVSKHYDIQPDCSSFEPRPCKPISVLDENGEISYDEYEESCPYHICIALQPVYPIAPNTSKYFLTDIWNVLANNEGSKMSMIGEQRWSNDFPRGSTHEDAFSNIKDSSEKVAFSIKYDSASPWFCSGANINYTARVEANTGYPPGRKEDLHAQCQYQRLLDTQTLADCRHLRFTCADCSDYYRNWLCAMAFPRCFPERTVTTYPVYNASDPSTTGVNGLVPTKIFGILKPCRGLCWAVIQRCQRYINFNCPLTDRRDYEDFPNCNTLGFDEGDTPYAKSIFW